MCERLEYPSGAFEPILEDGLCGRGTGERGRMLEKEPAFNLGVRWLGFNARLGAEWGADLMSKR